MTGFAGRDLMHESVRGLHRAGGWNYELRLGGYSSADEAGVAAARLRDVTGLTPNVEPQGPAER